MGCFEYGDKIIIFIMKTLH